MIINFKVFEFVKLPKKVNISRENRIIFSNDKDIIFRNISISKQTEENWGFKPLGLWYGFGDDWLQHIVRSKFKSRNYSSIFKIKITDNVLKLNGGEDITTITPFC